MAMYRDHQTERVAMLSFKPGNPSLGPSRLIGYLEGKTVVPCTRCRHCGFGEWETTLEPGKEYPVIIEERQRRLETGTIKSYVAHAYVPRQASAFWQQIYSNTETIELGTTGIEIVFLGGMAEAGSRTSALVIYNNQALLVDCGINVASLSRSQILEPHEMDLEDLESLSRVNELPEFEIMTHLMDVRGLQLVGILITHSHLDHYGGLVALKAILGDLMPPIYGTQFTRSMISHYVNDRDFRYPRLEPIEPGIETAIGPFRILPFGVPHAVMDALGYSIGVEGQESRVVFSGDLKAHYRTPRDIFAFTETLKGLPPTKALVLDSTNAGVPGLSGLEDEVEQGMIEILGRAPGRVIVTFFSTRFDRLKMLVELGALFGKEVGVWGASFKPTLEAARNRGLYLPNLSENRVFECDIIAVTGCQATDTSVAWRLSQGEQCGGISLRNDDTFVLSAVPIPGRITPVRMMLDNLLTTSEGDVWVDHHTRSKPIGCKETRTHVSGHGFQEDLRVVFESIQPEYVIPYHASVASMVDLADLVTSPATRHSLDPSHVILFEENGGRIVL